MTFWSASVQTFDSSDIFESWDRKELNGIKVLFNIGYEINLKYCLLQTAVSEYAAEYISIINITI